MDALGPGRWSYLINTTPYIIIQYTMITPGPPGDTDSQSSYEVEIPGSEWFLVLGFLGSWTVFLTEYVARCAIKWGP